jgi:hypothetical protein
MTTKHDPQLRIFARPPNGGLVAVDVPRNATFAQMHAKIASKLRIPVMSLRLSSSGRYHDLGTVVSRVLLPGACVECLLRVVGGGKKKKGAASGAAQAPSGTSDDEIDDSGDRVDTADDTQAMLELGVAMNEMAAKGYLPKDLKPPSLMLVGMQTSGKTSFLNYLAMDILGGAVKADTGTRCPVVYYFRTSPVELVTIRGHKDQVARAIPVKRVFEEVTLCMVELDRLDLFNVMPIEVHVEGPDRPTITVTDLPGLLSLPQRPTPRQQAHQREIAAMYQRYRDDGYVPLICSTFKVQDQTYHRSGLANVREALGGEISPEALVYVSHLDIVRTDHDATVSAFVRVAAEVLGIPKARAVTSVIVGSSKPQCLDPAFRAENEVAMDDPKFDYRKARDALREGIRSESQLMRRYTRQFDSVTLGLCSFGLTELTRMVNFRCASFVRGRLQQLVATLETNGLDHARSLRDLRGSVLDPLDAQGRLTDHIMMVREASRLICENLELLSESSFTVIADCYFPRSEAATRCLTELPHKLRRTVAEQLHFLKQDTEISGGLESIHAEKHLKRMDVEHPLHEEMIRRRSATNAADAILKLVGYCMLSQKLRPYSLDELWEFAGVLQPMQVFTADLRAGLRKLVVNGSREMCLEHVKVATKAVCMVYESLHSYAEAAVNSLGVLENTPPYATRSTNTCATSTLATIGSCASEFVRLARTWLTKNSARWICRRCFKSQAS